jgi:hypothetical protein
VLFVTKGPEHDISSEPLQQALDALIEVLEANGRRNTEAIARAGRIKAERARGLSYGEIVRSQERPLIVELTRQNLEALAEAGAAFRRLEARELHREGFTMDAIAELFGVTRQRISALLREAPTA